MPSRGSLGGPAQPDPGPRGPAPHPSAARGVLRRLRARHRRAPRGGRPRACGHRALPTPADHGDGRHEPKRRIQTGQSYLPRIDARARMLPAARLLQAASYAFGCRFPEAEREIEEALASPGAALWPTLRTYATIVRAAYIENQVGRSEEALVHLDEAAADLERREADDLLGFLPFAHIYRGYVLTDLGRYEETLADIPRTVEAARSARPRLGEHPARSGGCASWRSRAWAAGTSWRRRSPLRRPWASRAPATATAIGPPRRCSPRTVGIRRRCGRRCTRPGAR